MELYWTVILERGLGHIQTSLDSSQGNFLKTSKTDMNFGFRHLKMTWFMRCHVARKPISCFYVYNNNYFRDKITECFNQMYYSSMSCKMIFFCAILIYWKRKEMGYPLRTQNQYLKKKLPLTTKKSAFIAVELHLKVRVRPSSGSIKNSHFNYTS